MTEADLRLTQDIRKILNSGQKDENPRPKYADGTPAYTIKQFGVANTYDLRKEFPAITIRPTALKSAMDEVLWIYQQQTSDLSVLRNITDMIKMVFTLIRLYLYRILKIS